MQACATVRPLVPNLETRVPLWIDTPDALRAHLQQLPAWVGLDTEFIREKTFWPQLALVQIAIGDQPGGSEKKQDLADTRGCEALAGILMVAGALNWLSIPVALFIGTVGAVSVFKAVYVEKREIKCACVGGSASVPLGFVSLTENLMMVAMAAWMLVRT